MSSLTFDSQPGFFRRKLMLEFEQAPGFATSEATSCVYIAHVLVFTVIFLAALGSEFKQPLQTITIEFVSPAETAPASAVQVPSATKEQEYEVGFKKIFNGGANIDSTSRPGESSRPPIETAQRAQPPITKADSPLPFKLPSPHFARHSFSLPSPIISRLPREPGADRINPVNSPVPALVPVTVPGQTVPVPAQPVPLPMENFANTAATPLPSVALTGVTNPLPQSVLKPMQQPEPAPFLHNQTDLPVDLAPVVVSADGAEFPLPLPLPAPVSVAASEPPAPIPSRPAQAGSVFAFAPNVPIHPTSDMRFEGPIFERDPDWGPFMRAMQTRIFRWFYVNQDKAMGRHKSTIIVLFKVHADGTISDLRLESSDAETSVNDAALTAVKKAAPFASFPDAVKEPVDVQFTFKAALLHAATDKLRAPDE